MTMYALLENATVANVIVWDGQEPYDTALTLIELEEDSPVGIGWTLDGDAWVPPPAEPVEVDQASIDAEISRQAARQAALAKLVALGLTEEEALALVGG